MKQRDCFLKKARRTNKEMDWSAYRNLRNTVNNKVRSAKANYNRNLIQENIDDSKSFWRAMNRVLPNDKKSKQSVTSIKVGENSIVKAIGEKLSQRSDPPCQRQWSPSQNAEAVLTKVHQGWREFNCQGDR